MQIQLLFRKIKPNSSYELYCIYLGKVNEAKLIGLIIWILFKKKKHSFLIADTTSWYDKLFDFFY